MSHSSGPALNLVSLYCSQTGLCLLSNFNYIFFSSFLCNIGTQKYEKSAAVCRIIFSYENNAADFLLIQLNANLRRKPSFQKTIMICGF